MPVINGPSVSVRVGTPHSVLLKSNPADAAGNPATPNGNYVWTADNPAMVRLTPQDAFGQNCLVEGLLIGNTRVLAENHPAIGDEIQVFPVTVTAGDYDHDVPSATSPV